MEMLIAGLVLWIATHLLPTLGAKTRQSIVDKLGFNAYRGLFTLSIFTALALIIFGWRSALPSFVYTPDPALRHPAMGLVLLGFILMGASNRPSRIGRIVRHPQLTGVLLWAIAHLLANGDSRSLVLFGGFAAWTVLEMVLISRREGTWVKKPAPGWGVETLGIIAPLLVAAAVMYFHDYLSGVALL